LFLLRLLCFNLHVFTLANKTCLACCSTQTHNKHTNTPASLATISSGVEELFLELTKGMLKAHRSSSGGGGGGGGAAKNKRRFVEISDDNDGEATQKKSGCC
jgi:hypothetical protein